MLWHTYSSTSLARLTRGASESLRSLLRTTSNYGHYYTVAVVWLMMK